MAAEFPKKSLGRNLVECLLKIPVYYTDCLILLCTHWFLQRRICEALLPGITAILNIQH